MAKKNCEDRCKKGQYLKPDHIIVVKQWPKRFKK